MAEQDPATKPPAADEPDLQPKPERKSSAPASGVMIMIVMCFLVVILTPIVTYFAVRMTEKQPEAAPKVEPPGQIEYFDLDAVVVNIDNTQGTRFLRLMVHFEVTPPSLAERLKSRKALIKDRVISAIGNKSISDLESQQGRDALKREIKQKVNAWIAERPGELSGTVLDVFFSEYLIQ